MTRKDTAEIIFAVIALWLIFHVGIGSTVWQWRHPHCNRFQVVRHLGDVLTFSETEECR